MFREFDSLDNELEDEFNWGLGRRRRSLSGLAAAYPSTPGAAADLGCRPHPLAHHDMLGGGAYPGSVPNLVTGQHLEETVDGGGAGGGGDVPPNDVNGLESQPSGLAHNLKVPPQQNHASLATTQSQRYLAQGAIPKRKDVGTQRTVV